MFEDISFFLFMPAAYHTQWNRYDLWWFIGPSPWYVKLCFGGSLTSFMMFPIFAIGIEKYVAKQYQDILALEIKNMMKLPKPGSSTMASINVSKMQSKSN